MPNYTFWNIGKANQEIVRLNAKISEIESAKPEDQSSQLADAVASNEQVSVELNRVSADLAAKETALDQLTTKFNTLNTELDSACLAANVTDAPSDGVEKIKSLQSAVASAIAKIGVSQQEIPANSGATPQAKQKMSRANFVKLASSEQMKFASNGGTLTE